MKTIKQKVNNIVSLFDTIKHFIHIGIRERNQLFCHHMYKLIKDKYIVRCEKCGCSNRACIN